MEHLYDVLNLLMGAYVEAGDRHILGGELDAYIGLIRRDNLAACSADWHGTKQCKRHNLDTPTFEAAYAWVKSVCPKAAHG